MDINTNNTAEYTGVFVQVEEEYGSDDCALSLYLNYDRKSSALFTARMLQTSCFIGIAI